MRQFSLTEAVFNMHREYDPIFRQKWDNALMEALAMRKNSGESISTPKKPKPKKRPASKPKI